MPQRGGITLVSVYLEPDIKASGLNLRLLEALAAFCLGFEGPWIAMGDWNMEQPELTWAGWIEPRRPRALAARCHAWTSSWSP